MKISVAGSDILASGTVQSIGEQTIEFRPLPSPFDDYVVEVTFQTDENVVGPHINWKTIDPKRYRVLLTNFSKNVWSSTRTPVYVANHLGRKVLLHISSVMIGVDQSAPRLMAYTFLDGGPING